ncbi:MAG: ATP-binding cassette domain-containing protein [Acidobacteria bacterium]|nr:ATP-binding cassette domain-containing protein [Acidobacteriota bacterium]
MSSNGNQLRTALRSPENILITAPLIEVSGLSKKYGPDVAALDNIHLTVERGEWLAVMGPSGSGKSTLLNILGCLDRPTTGEVRIAGTDISRLSKQELNRFRAEQAGFIFQQFHLIPYLTALENVLLAQYFHSLTDYDQALGMLSRVGLAHRAHHLPSQLSGGEQQRVAIARALINQPSLLLADEPTGNLDAANELIVMKLLEDLHAEGNTIIMVTHDPTVARSADRTITLEHGRISQEVPFSFEEQRVFDEVLSQIWVMEEDRLPPLTERVLNPGAGSWANGCNLPVSGVGKVLPLMKEIGLLRSERPVLEMTERGRLRAASVIRRHRLAERLFADTFQMRDEQELESNACTFEHILSPEVTERICMFLNHPQHCPHGSPIPPGPCCSTAS